MLEQWAKPVLDSAKIMREIAGRLRRAGRPGPVEETTPPKSAA